MTPTVFEDLGSLLSAGPCDLGCTDWQTVSASSVSKFADATWAPPPGPHDNVPSFMLLALTNLFMPQLLEVKGASSGVNYGTGAVRFNAPVRPGERARACAFLMGAQEVPGGVQTSVRIRIELEGSEEPAAVVESLSRWLR